MKQVWVSDRTHLRIKLAATLERVTIRDFVERAVERAVEERVRRSSMSLQREVVEGTSSE